MVEDYLLTNGNIAPFLIFLEEHAKTLSENVVNKFAYVYSVQKSFYQTALASVNQHLWQYRYLAEKILAWMRK